MNVFEILTEDHQKIKAVMDKIENITDTSDQICDQLFQEFKKLFNLHDKIEDDIVYPALIDIPELTRLIRKSYQAHHVVEVALLELRMTPYANDNWIAKFSVTRDSILKHIEEEETKIFPTAKEKLSQNTIDDLTQRTNALKEKYE